MKHLLHKLSSLRLLTLLAVLLGMGGSTAWADTTYRLQLVTSVTGGHFYVFEQDGYVMKNSISSNELRCTNSYETTGLTGSETYVWRLYSATGGGYNMQNMYNEAALGNPSGSNLSWSNTNSVWTFNFQPDGTVQIQNKNNENRFLGFTPAGSHAYKAYAASYLSSDTYPHAIKVYELVEEAETPYTVANVINGNADGKTNIFVEGYIVGSWKNDAFNASDLVDTNLALADSYDSNTTIPVELPSESLQTSWGPASNPHNVRVAKVRIKGNGGSYLSTNGITGVSVITKVAEAVKISDALGFATYASDSPLDFTDKDIDAYIAVTKGNGTGVTFTQVNKVPANTGVLIHYSGAKTEEIPVFDGTGADAVTGNTFVQGTGATVATDDGDNYNYILNKVGGHIGFYRANDKKVALNRAYISILKSESGSSVKEFLTFDFDADAIRGLSPNPSPVSEGSIFNLAGQKMNRLQKGINIVNGRKVFMK